MRLRHDELRVDTLPAPDARERVWRDDLCRAGCGSVGYYRGYCYRHWRLAECDGRKVSDAMVRREVAAARSNADAVRRLGWQALDARRLLAVRCRELGIPTPAERVKAHNRTQ